MCRQLPHLRLPAGTECGPSLLLRALDRSPPALFLADHLLTLPSPAGGRVLQALAANLAALTPNQLEHAESLALELLARERIWLKVCKKRLPSCWRRN